MLNRVFQDIQKSKRQFLRSEKGPDFENKFEDSLKTNAFNRKLSDDDSISLILKTIKSDILNKTSEGYLKNIYLHDKSMENCFVREPYGSQNFPDFLIFTKKLIVPIEIKYSGGKSNVPVWNSNLPKSNAIYVFGSYGRQDVTFFLGSDVLPMNERKELIDFFEEIKLLEDEFRKKMKQKVKDSECIFNMGFDVYIRRAYQQNKNINTNASPKYFLNPNREIIEKKVIDFCNET